MSISCRLSCERARQTVEQHCVSAFLAYELELTELSCPEFDFEVYCGYSADTVVNVQVAIDSVIAIDLPGLARQQDWFVEQASGTFIIIYLSIHGAYIFSYNDGAVMISFFPH